MSLQGYIFLENKNLLNNRKEKFFNYNDIYLLFTKNFT